MIDDDLHTRACLEYAAKTRKSWCISECADARRARGGAVLEQPLGERAWFRTLTGRQFFYDAPEEYAFSIEETAHALSNLCRFVGHLERFYSVGQHSAIVALLVEQLLQLPGQDFPTPTESLRQAICRAALLHDGSEAFMADLPRPLKRMLPLAGYRALEDRVQHAILKMEGLDELPEFAAGVIKTADQLVLALERRDLRLRAYRRVYSEADLVRMGIKDDDDGLPDWLPAELRVEPVAAWEARSLFLKEWTRYGGTTRRDAPGVPAVGSLREPRP